MILVDSSIWIDFFRNKDSEPSRRLAQAIQDKQAIALCGIILTEVLQGIGDDSEFDEVSRFLEMPTYYEVTRSTYLLAARLYRNARKKGLTIRNTTDCLIAACAIEHKARLLHNDRDFEKIARVSDLRGAAPYDR